jgi:hypothetical protein
VRLFFIGREWVCCRSGLTKGDCWPIVAVQIVRGIRNFDQSASVSIPHVSPVVFGPPFHFVYNGARKKNVMLKLMRCGFLFALLAGCSQNEEAGTATNPIACAELFESNPARTLSGVCRIAGEYDYGVQAIFYDENHSIFISDVDWVESLGNKSSQLDLTGHFVQEPSGYIIINRVFSTIDLTARKLPASLD